MTLVTSWSFSRWETYEQCPLRFKLKNIDKQREPSSPVLDRGTDIHKLAEDYVLSAKPLALPEYVDKARGGNVISPYQHFEKELKHLRDNKAYVEQDWGFRNDWSWNGRNDWFGSDVWFRAKADACVVYDDDTALLVDWKTGKKYEKNELQVQLFSLSALMRFPNVNEVDTRLWYVDAPDGDNEIDATYYRKDVPALQKDWGKRIKPMFADQKFPPKPNAKCRFCHFRKENGGPCRF